MHLYVCQYSGYVTVPPGLRQMRGGFVCAPCLANWGGGGLPRFSVLFGGWMFRLVRRVFRKRPQCVTRTLSAAKQGGAERPGDGCPCVGAEETYGVAASTRKQRVTVYQSVTPVRASPKTAVN